MKKTNSILSNEELLSLKKAKQLLENPGIAIKLSSMIANPIQKGLDLLPENWNSKLAEITQNSLLKAANVAIFTMRDKETVTSNNLLHTVAAGTTGTLGGLFGIAGLAVELPITSTIILRSIADIARSNGESINETTTKLACLEVFALGGNSIEDDNLETSYYATRTFLSSYMSQATKYISEQGIINESAPVVLNIVAKIAERFGLQVTEKSIAQSVPIIGAAGGAIINTLFISHFQDMAKGHFTVRKLERIYGQETIQSTYNNLKTSE